MNKEKDIIRIISGHLPRSDMQINNLFESDAEIILFKGTKLLFNIDSYSKEDHFCENDAYCLGWNVCYCTISDIFASGGIPLFYAHSISLEAQTWDNIYIDAFSRGIKDVLQACNTSFIGGDTGLADNWSYTGTIIGETQNSICRKGAQKGDFIYISGNIGKGNMMAAHCITNSQNILDKKYNKFDIRFTESKLISQYANSCIDTSDGLINALNTISEINETGYLLETIPYLPQALETFLQLNIPKEILFLGECGEYELLFTIKKENEKQFCSEALKNKLHFTKLGCITDNNLRGLKTGNGIINLADFSLDARDYTNQSEYLHHLLAYAKLINNKNTM